MTIGHRATDLPDTVPATRVGLHVTDRCQLDCDHCSRDPGQQPADLDLGVIEQVLRTAGAAHVSLTGGEPTLHPRFAEILDLVVALGMTWDMVSNGRRYDRVARWLTDVPARRDACRIVMLSLDGATDAVHDRIRGAGQRREVLAAMAVLVDMGVPFGIAATVHALNVHEIEDMVREAEALGASAIRFAMTQPTGTPLDLEMRLDPEGWRVALSRVRAAGVGAAIPVLLAEGWPELTPRGQCAPLRGGRLHVDVAGRLTLCCAHSGSPGPGVDGTVAGSAEDGIHPELLTELRALQLRTIERIGSDPTDPAWAEFECNRCLGVHGRPHWTADHTSGTMALRERWRGSAHRSIVHGRMLRVLP